MRYWYSLIQKVIEKKNRGQSGVKIYMFHQVNDDLSKWLNPEVSITAKSFYQFVERHEKAGYEFLAISDLSDSVGGNKAILTFDDIFEDAFENAFPYLIKRAIPFSVFISESYIDAPEYINTQQLQQLAAQPLCTIGFHSKNHKLMRKMTDWAQLDEMDCTEFEKRIGKKVNYFAFPYGSIYACDKKSIEKAKNMGYQYVFSTLMFECSPSILSKRYYFLPRINVCEDNYIRLLERAQR